MTTENNDGLYAHRLTNDKLDLCYSASDKNWQIKSEAERELEAFYFAMCLLIPEDIFMETIGLFFGGLDNVKDNYEFKMTLAHMFNVEYKLIEARIQDLLEKTRQEKIYSKTGINE